MDLIRRYLFGHQNIWDGTQAEVSDDMHEQINEIARDNTDGELVCRGRGAALDHVNELLPSLLLATTMLVAPVIAHAACIRVGAGESVQAAIDSAKPGDVILLADGTHEGPIDMKSGVTVRGEGGAVIDCSGSDTCVTFGGVDGATLQNVSVTGAGGGGWAIGIVIDDASNNVLDGVESYGNEGPGLLISGDSSGNTISNGSYHDNYDPQADGGNADGISVSGVSGDGNRIVGNKIYANSDDGLDLWQSEAAIYIEGNEAYDNGRDGGDGNGFKLGKNQTGPNHTLIGNVAHNNDANGFDDNGAQGEITMEGNSSYNNGGEEYAFSSAKMEGSGNSTAGGQPRRTNKRGKQCHTATAAEMKAFCAHADSMASASCVAFQQEGTLPEACDKKITDACGGTVVANTDDDVPTDRTVSEHPQHKKQPEDRKEGKEEDEEKPERYRPVASTDDDGETLAEGVISGGWSHTYSISWLEGKLSFFFDGEKVWETTEE